MSNIGAIHPSPAQLSCTRDAATLVALDALRRLAADPAPTTAARAFAVFLEAARTVAGVRAPTLAAPGRATPTKDERRLLRAVAAAQGGDEPLLDNYIYRLALDPTVRAELAAALRALAATLAARGCDLSARDTQASRQKRSPASHRYSLDADSAVRVRIGASEVTR